MLDFVKRRLPLREGESKLALTLGFILFSNYAAMGITKVVSVSGFLSEVRDHYILLVWAVDMVLLILATGVQSLIVDRFDRVKLISAVLAIFMLLYAVLPVTFLIKGFPASIGYTFIYLLNDQQWRFFPVVFWIRVNDIYDPGTGRRVMPFIGIFAFVGTIIGLAIAAADARFQFGAVSLLWLNAGIFLLALLVSRFQLRAVKLPPPIGVKVDSMKTTLTEGWDFIKTVPAFAYLALGMLAAGSVMTVLLYDALSDAKIELGSGFQSYYAVYNLTIAVVSILVQSVSTRIIERFTLKRSFLIQPVVMFISTVANFLIPGFLGSGFAQGVSRVTYDTTDLSARKAFQAMVPNEKRGRVSIFLDGYLPSGGTILGSLITFTIISIGLRFGIPREQYSLVYIGVGIAVSLLAIFTAFKVRSTYEQSMLSWQLKRRTRGASLLSKLDFDEGDE